MIKLYQSSFLKFFASSARTTATALFVVLLWMAGYHRASGQTAYPMSSGNYTEDFATITNWTNNFAGSGGEIVPNHSHWGLASVAPATMNPGISVTASTVFAAFSSGGVQKGGLAGLPAANPAGTLVFLATGATDNTAAGAGDLYLDFSNRIAGTISFDWQAVANSTGNRNCTFRVYAINAANTQFDQIGSDISITNNVASSGSVSALALPSHFNYKANARLRFYIVNGTGGTTGSRPKMAIDNLTITSTPCTPTKLVVTSVNAGNCPVLATPFNTIVQSQASTNDACAVAANTNLSLTVNTGTGTLGGTTTGTLNAGQNTFTFTGNTYDVAETGVSLNVARTSGDVLTSGNSNTFEVIASGAPEPSTQGTIATSNLKFNSVDLTLSGGNGANRIVVARAGGAVTTAPTDAVAYSANAYFGSGATVAASEYVVYNGSGTTVTVNGLVQGTAYHFAVFEYNGTGCALNYNPNLTGIANVTAPTQSLVAGDISIIQFKGTGTDGIGFVALTDIGGGTTIRFTDASWIGDATNGVTGDKFVTSETDHYMWTSPMATNGITAGTVVTMLGGTVNFGTLTDTLGGPKSLGAISNTGDNFFAYRGARTRPQITLLAGFASQPFISTGTANAANSYRPGALAGNLAVEMTSGVTDNMYLNVANLCGTPSSLRTILASPANWFRYSVIVPPVQDFQAASFWNFNIVGALATEPTVSATATTFNPQSSTISLTLGAGNGTERLVVAKLTSNATDIVPTDGVLYTYNTVFNTPATEMGAGSGNFVVYSGSAGSITVSSLTPLTSYTFTVYEYNDVPCINFKTTAPGVATGSTSVLKYYSKSAQKTNLQNLSAWSITQNELGASPANFTDAGVWYVVDDPASTIGNTWSIGGASSRVIVQSGGALTIPSGFALTTAGGSGVNVGYNGTLTMANSTMPTLFSVDSAFSTVNFDMGGTVVVPAKTYCNLRFANGVKQMPTGTGVNGVARFDNTVIVKGNFTVDATTIDPSGAPFSFINCHGNVTSSNASVWGTAPDALTLNFRGTGNQTFAKTGGGPDILLFKISTVKAGGKLVLTGSNNLDIQQDVDFFMSGTAKFNDGGNTIKLGDDLRMSGTASNYILSGTFNLTNAVGDNNDIEDGSNGATQAVLNNVVFSGTYAGILTGRILPTSGSATTTIRGNLSMTNAGSVLSLFGNEVKLGGNFSNVSTLATSFVEGTSTLHFFGTAPQTVTSGVTGGESYANILNNNNAGVTFANDITVLRNWTNNGVINLGSSNTTFAGTVTQNVGGTKRTTFNNLNLNNTTGSGFSVTATGKVSVTNTVTLATNAKLTVVAGGELRMVSTAGTTARIAAVPAGATITGNITAERYVASKGWHLTGTATGGQTITSWNDDLATAGPMPGVESPNPGSNTSMIFKYNQAGTINYLAEINGWEVPTTSALNQYEGYRVFMPAGAVLDNSGPIGTGSISIPLAYSGATTYIGYNLITNPHLSAFDWNHVSVVKTNVDNSVVVWNPVSVPGGRYEYFGSPVSGSVLNNAINPVASGQGFFVHANAPGASVAVGEAAKITGGTFIRSAVDNQGTVKIKLEDAHGMWDDAAFRFFADATAEHDAKYDGGKMLNPAMNVYTITPQGKHFAVNGLPFEGQQMTIPVGFSTSVGAHTLSFQGLNDVVEASQVYLRDNDEGIVVDLNENASYSFVNSSASANNTRFELVFTNGVTDVKATTVASKAVVYPNPSTGRVFNIALSNAAGSVEVEILDVLGRRVDAKTFAAQSGSCEITMPNPAQSGQYMVRIKSGSTIEIKPLIVR